MVSLSALTQGSVSNANPLQMGTQTTVPCGQAEDSGLLGPLQSPNWVKVCLVSIVFFLPVSIVPGVEKCLVVIQCLFSVFTHVFTDGSDKTITLRSLTQDVKSKFLSHQVSVYRHQANQCQHRPRYTSYQQLSL